MGIKPLGGVASLSIVRDGKTVAAQLALAAAPETPPRDARRIKSRSPFQGAEVVNLSPAVIVEMSLDAADGGPLKGVIVDDVPEDSLAANFGLQKGDIVVDVNGAEIKTTADLDEACAQRARYWDLTISRGGQVIRTRIGG